MIFPGVLGVIRVSLGLPYYESRVGCKGIFNPKVGAPPKTPRVINHSPYKSIARTGIDSACDCQYSIWHGSEDRYYSPSNLTEKDSSCAAS
ncbi:hypothetical protein SUGI_0940900 [Cryptomeria japonica]|nr:hypothetical protein SUGI_0940900 [Cryptomeria japonica]